MTRSLLDALAEILDRAHEHNPGAEVAPQVVLWPDPEAQFAAVVDALRDRRPMLRLGAFDATAGDGPAYWLRCAVAGTVAAPAAGTNPQVIYLPGVGREQFRAVEDCPDELAPIAELQYRGAWFTDPHGKDWTLGSLLSNQERGLGLSVATDDTTQERLVQLSGQLLDRSMHELASQAIDAEFLNGLLNPDPVGRLLAWLDDPAGFVERSDEVAWAAFVDQCRSRFSFDPASEGPVIGGRRLGEGDGAWGEVWRRFVDNPQRFPGVADQLRQGKPTDVLLFEMTGAWPQDNEEEEARLLEALLGIADAPEAAARSAITELWSEHEARRGWVWAQLDQAPLVFALEHLLALAGTTQRAAGSDIAGYVEWYRTNGWEVDAAFTRAVTAVDPARLAERAAVTGAAAALYRPWLDRHARAFQALVKDDTYEAGPAVSTEAGTVTVFVDGLRLDVARAVAASLGDDLASVEASLAALPTVTSTSKPALTPVAAGALSSGDGIAPSRASSGAVASAAVLRSLMVEAGGQVLGPTEVGDPTGWAWTEAGTIDSVGHNYGIALLDRLDREVSDIVARVRQLLAAGWSQVHLVTDHGWVLLPGGLPKAELPVHTTELRKGRCARLKPGADVTHQTVGWHWDADVRIAVAPGVHCFEAGKEYEHGGVSPQECIVPRVVVRTTSAEVRSRVTQRAAVTGVKWLGLLCRITYEHVAAGASVDLRALPGDASTSVAASSKETTVAGKASLHVEDEELEGERAYLVVVAPDGTILAQRDVTIGQNR